MSTEIKQPVIAGEKTEAEEKAEQEQKRAMRHEPVVGQRARGLRHYRRRRCADCGR